MKPLFIHYPKCSTCQKAAKWLEDHHIDYTSRDIVAHNPTIEELSLWASSSRKPLPKFFNTSGLRYKALHLKDIVQSASEQELLTILASEGMLVKRPLLITQEAILIGFKESEWSDSLLKK